MVAWRSRACSPVPVLILLATQTVNVVGTSGHHIIIASHHVDLDLDYWRNEQKTRPKAGIFCDR